MPAYITKIDGFDEDNKMMWFMDGRFKSKDCKKFVDMKGSEGASKYDAMKVTGTDEESTTEVKWIKRKPAQYAGRSESGFQIYSLELLLGGPFG